MVVDTLPGPADACHPDPRHRRDLRPGCPNTDLAGAAAVARSVGAPHLPGTSGGGTAGNGAGGFLATFHASWPNTDLLPPTQQQPFLDHEQTVTVAASVVVKPNLPVQTPTGRRHGLR